MVRAYLVRETAATTPDFKGRTYVHVGDHGAA